MRLIMMSATDKQLHETYSQFLRGAGALHRSATSVSVIKMTSFDTRFMNKTGKWLGNVFISMFHSCAFQYKTSLISVRLPENAQGNTRHLLMLRLLIHGCSLQLLLGHSMDMLLKT